MGEVICIIGISVWTVGSFRRIVAGRIGYSATDRCYAERNYGAARAGGARSWCNWCLLAGIADCMNLAVPGCPLKGTNEHRPLHTGRQRADPAG